MEVCGQHYGVAALLTPGSYERYALIGMLGEPTGPSGRFRVEKHKNSSAAGI